VPDEPTRERVLTAAWRLARERGSVDFTLAEVAVRAGISRQGVYLHFANRAGLLVEMARHADHHSGFVRGLAAARRAPAVESARRVLRLWYRHLAAILPVARALEAAAITGADGSAAYHDRMDAWHETLRISVAALAEAGRLRPEWTVGRATDWVWARTQPSGYEYLLSRGWSPARAAGQLTRSILAEIATGDAPAPADQPAGRPASGPAGRPVRGRPRAGSARTSR
jgi:AcrR family transcriptional regulator